MYYFVYQTLNIEMSKRVTVRSLFRGTFLPLHVVTVTGIEEIDITGADRDRPRV